MMEKLAPKNQVNAPGTIAALSLMFSSVYSFVEIVRSSDVPYLVGGSVGDWAQIGLGMGLYWALTYVLGLVFWFAMRMILRVPKESRVVQVFAPALSAWVLLMVLSASFVERCIVTGALAGAAGILLVLGLSEVFSFPVVSVIWSMASIAGIVSLYATSHVFFVHEQRAVVAGAISGLWIVIAGLFSMAMTFFLRSSPVSRVVWLLALVAGGALLPLALGVGRFAAAVATRSPQSGAHQMVFVVCDTLGADYLSVYDGPVQVPNLEALANESVVFERCYSTAPWTTPSMTSMFSSKYPPSMTFGAANVQWIEASGPRGAVASYFEGADGRSQVERMAAQQFLTAAFTANPTLCRSPWLFRGYKHVLCTHHLTPEDHGVCWRFSRMRALLRWGFPSLFPEHHANTTRTVMEHAVEFIRRNRNRSFFLWVHFMDPHDPYDPLARYRTQTNGPELFGPEDGTYQYLDEGRLSEEKRVLNEGQREYARSLFLAEIRQLDEAIGRIKRTVESCATGDVHLCLVADHGEELWQHGEWGHGHSLHDEVIHVPLLFWGGGLKPRRIVEPISTINVLPTVTELMSLRSNDEWRGTSIVRVLRGKEELEPQPCFMQGTKRADAPVRSTDGIEPSQMPGNEGGDPSLRPPLRGVISGNLKLIEELGADRVHLYDMLADPEEKNDLAGQPAAAADVDRLRLLLEEWARSFPSTIPELQGGDLDDDIRQQIQEEMQAMGYLRR